MATLSIFNAEGKKVGSYEIDPAELAPRVNKQLLHDAIVMYQANQRQGSHKTKTRGEVAATTKKMYRQKGTGNARAGSRASGIRRGGGHIFALRPRDYSYRLPRKALQLAMRMALAAKLRDDQIRLIDKLSFPEPKTREMATILKALGLADRSLLVATAQYDQNVYRSARNIDGVSIASADELNALSVMQAQNLLLTPEAMDALKNKASHK